MIVNNVGNINTISKIKNKIVPRIKINNGPARDTFERSSSTTESSFDIKIVTNELKDLKNFKGLPKFDEKKLEFIKNELIKKPEKWEPLKVIIQNPKILGSMSCDIVQKDIEIIKGLSNLSTIQNEDNSPRFSPFDIKALSNNLTKKEEFENAKVLAATDMGIDNIIALSKNKNIKTPERIVDNYNKMKESCGNNLIALSFDTDIYDSNSFALIADLRDSSKKIELFDKEINNIASEEVQAFKHPNGKQYQIKKTVDRRNHSVSKVRLEVQKNMPQPVLINEIRVIKDKNGKTIRKEHTEQSEVPGILNIKHVYPDGTEKVLSSASVNPKTGITTVKKDMTSLDGTRTQYLYEDDPMGNRISDYVITDKDGNTLLKNSMSFEVISDNKFISSKNDKKYEITVNEKDINIQDMNTKENSKITFENYLEGNKEKIISVLKKMPGEELIALGNTVKHLNGIDDINYSTYGIVNKRIKTGDNLFVMLHELGHAKDYNEVEIKEEETLKKSIFSNEKVNEIFEKEKEAFNKEFPTAQREHINYFIKTSEQKDGLQETIAETNALLNTYNSDDLFSIRSQYLQHYFPRTIVEISKSLNKQ